MALGTPFVFKLYMAIFSLQNNKIYRIEVRFQPGIPRIEILGSSAKSIKDAATKAKLLLIQLGMRPPRNKKIYICIDPFVSSHDGLELGIFMAMKQAIVNSTQEAFVFGNLSFDGKTSSTKEVAELLPYIPNGMNYLVGGKKLNVMHEILWQKKSKTKEMLWTPSLGPLLLSALYNKESILFLVANNTLVDEFIFNIVEIYFELHQEPVRVYKNLEKNNATTKDTKNFIAIGKFCPCGKLDAWKRGACQFTQKKCESYLKNMNLKGRRALIFKIQESDLVKMKVENEIRDYPVQNIPLAVTGEDKIWIESLVKNIAVKDQRSAQATLLLSLKHYYLLSSKWV